MGGQYGRGLPLLAAVQGEEPPVGDRPAPEASRRGHGSGAGGGAGGPRKQALGSVGVEVVGGGELQAWRGGRVTCGGRGQLMVYIYIYIYI